MSRMIGPYEIVGELGRGGMGIVYKAREEALQRFVAIKMLGNQLADNDSVVQRFMREARAVAGVNHPNLVQVFRVDKHDGQPYFVMEYVEGESLKSLIQREQQMQPPRALKILGEVAAGLAAAHEKGVVHRDIKPENIMLTRFGGVKVVDFGIARVDEPGTRLTTTGVGLGTPSYLSPEVCLSKDVDARSDIFSLGVVLFEMLTGETPFQSDSPFELMTKVVEARVPDIKALNPNVDDGVRQILAKMIAKRPKLRYQSCNELISDIEDYRAGRVPRWSRDVKLETVPAESSAAAAPAEVAGDGERPEPPAPDAANAPAGAGAPGRSAPAGTARTETVAPAGARRTRSRAGLAIAIGLLLLVGAGGATWMLFADELRPLAARLGGGSEAAPARAAAEPDSSDVTASVAVDAASNGSASGASRPPAGDADAPAAPPDPGPGGSADLVADAIPRAPPSVDEPAAADTPSPVGPGAAGGTGSAAGTAAIADPGPRAPGAVASPGAQAGAGEHSGPGEAVGIEASSAAPAEAESGPDAPVSGGMPADPRVAVVAVGDPAVAGPVALELRRSLVRASFEVVDEQLLDGLVYAESLAGVVRAARSGGVDVLVHVDVVPAGERQLRFYGRRDVQQLASLEVRVVDLHARRNLGRPVRRELEYVGLTAAREARAVAGPVARGVVARMRALRESRGPD